MPWGRWVWPGHCLQVFARRRGWTEAEQRESIVCKGSSGFDRGQRVTTVDVSEWGRMERTCYTCMWSIEVELG